MCNAVRRSSSLSGGTCRRSSFIPRSMRIGPTGERYRRPNPTEPRVSAMLNFFTYQGHVAGVDERHRTKSTANRNAQLGVQDDEALPAAREAVAHRAVPVDRGRTRGPTNRRLRKIARSAGLRRRWSGRSPTRVNAVPRPTRVPRTRTGPRAPRNCRYVNPCTNVLRKPTSDPSALAASSASVPMRLPDVGSSGSLRVSRISEDATLDRRLSGNRRSISG